LVLLLVLVVVGTVLVLLLSRNSGGGNTTTAESSKQEAAQNKGQGETNAGLGENVDVGDASWYITSAEPTNQLDDRFGVTTPKQGELVVVNFRFTNNGTESTTPTQNDMALLASDGRRFDLDTDTLRYVPNDKNIFLKQVKPKTAEDGEVIFSVSPDASGYKLELSNTNSNTGDEAYVNLGF
jgi:hypothetical protein